MRGVVFSSGIGAVFAVAASLAFAQRSVTLYGLVDTAIPRRCTTRWATPSTR
nr:porin [Burkholderia ubonensis]